MFNCNTETSCGFLWQFLKMEYDPVIYDHSKEV